LIRDYKAEDGVEMLKQIEVDCPVEWCREAEGEGRAFSIIYDGKLVCCAGVMHKLEGIGIAWALYPPDIGNYHIDPRLAMDKLLEIKNKFNYRRVEATVRVDFPAGAKYLEWMGFKHEGRMKMYEPDKTDAYLYART